MAFQQATDGTIKHRMSGLETVEVATWKVNVKEAYNLNYLYTILHDWLVEEGWATKEEAEFPETYYQQRDNPNFGKELRIRWRLKRPSVEPENKIFSYMMDIDFYTLGIKDTEITHKGQKIKADKSEFEIACSAMVVIDREGFIGKSIFKDFKKLLLERVLKQHFLMHKKAVYASSYRFR